MSVIKTLLELKNTEHSFYCSDSNYYVNGHQNYGRCDYDTWEDFKANWLNERTLDIDDDLNHLFRFDILEDEDGENTGTFRLFLFFILQRKGIFRPVVIHTITEDDLPEIEEFLRLRWQYLKSQWKEFSEDPARRREWLEAEKGVFPAYCGECPECGKVRHRDNFCSNCGISLR